MLHWYPLAIYNLLAPLGNRSLESGPILGVKLVVVFLLDKLQANFGAFREIHGIPDDDSSALYATVQ
ncbi:MAG TPA: hypothetical protein VIM14_01000 [Polyangia bacterium]